MDLNLENKIVLITGGSLGIGYAVAAEFLKQKAKVVICGRNEEKLEAAVRLLQRDISEGMILKKKCDVTKMEELEALVDFVEEKMGGIDILINNAGTGSEEKNMDAPDDKWYYYWDLHVMAAIRLVRLCVPLMKKRPGEGVILNTTSVCASQPLYYEPIYNVTKAALNMYSKCLSDELIKDNIRVNSIAPGLVRTPDWENTAKILSEQQGITSEQYFKKIATDMAPIARFASPEEIAHSFVFLCSPLSSYVVGANFHIDGGAIKTIN